MSPEELIDKLYAVEARISNMEPHISDMESNSYSHDAMINELFRRLNNSEAELERISAALNAAITTAVHELIDFLRYEDIQALDEDEFVARVRELISASEPCSLPF